MEWLDKIGCEFHQVGSRTEVTLFKGDDLMLSWEVETDGTIAEVAVCGTYGDFKMHTRLEVRALCKSLNVNLS